MKRSFNDTKNSSSSNNKNQAILEGVVVGVTTIFDTSVEKNAKYWTCLICDSNQNVNQLTKYVSSKIPCRLYDKMTESLNNKSGVIVNKLRLSGDHLYTASNETIATTKVALFEPSCIQNRSLEDVESMCDGQYVSFTCKIVDIGPVRIQKINFIQLHPVQFRTTPSFSIMVERKSKNLKEPY